MDKLNKHNKLNKVKKEIKITEEEILNSKIRINSYIDLGLVERSNSDLEDTILGKIIREYRVKLKLHLNSLFEAKIKLEDENQNVVVDSDVPNPEKLNDELSLKKVWDLDENSGKISVDTYILNYLAFNNSSHLEDVLAKVPSKFIEERLVALKGADLKEDFMGSETEMQKALAAFEISFLKHKSKLVKGL